jgi:hypothetical protein
MKKRVQKIFIIAAMDVSRGILRDKSALRISSIEGSETFVTKKRKARDVINSNLIRITLILCNNSTFRISELIRSIRSMLSLLFAYVDLPFTRTAVSMIGERYLFLRKLIKFDRERRARSSKLPRTGTEI